MELNPVQFYHGSDHEFSPGDVLTPEGGAPHAGKWPNNPDFTPGKHVHVTRDPWMARHMGGSNVYKVEPTGPLENDAKADSDMGVDGQWNFRTTHPVRVTGVE
jgi:hypothetical protein